MERVTRALPATIVVAAVTLVAGFAVTTSHRSDVEAQRDREQVRIVAAPADGAAVGEAMRAPAAADGSGAITRQGRDSTLIAALAPRGSDDLRLLADAITDQPDGGDADRLAEERAGALLARHLRLAGGGHRFHVACTAVTCEATGTLSGSADALETTPLLEAMVTEGFSPGPLAHADGSGGTDFLVYLNREG